jgi:hypothetical protein
VLSCGRRRSATYATSALKAHALRPDPPTHPSRRLSITPGIDSSKPTKQGGRFAPENQHEEGVEAFAQKAVPRASDTLQEEPCDFISHLGFGKDCDGDRP